VSFIAAAIVGGGALIGGVVSANAAGTAAGDQEQAALNAQGISQGEFQTITNQEQPFLNAGYGATGALDYGLGIGGNTASAQAGAGGLGYGSLSAPFTSADWQSMSPAYNFQVQQGQQGVVNGDASSQGALSGSTLKDLTNYNQNAASTSFNNAFNQYQTQQGNVFSRLSGIAGLGSSAAANLGAQGVNLAGQAGQAATNYGTAAAGGAVGQANAISGSLSSALPWLASSGGGGGSTDFGGFNPATDTGQPATAADYAVG
jgi:hypothetical protein